MCPPPGSTPSADPNPVARATGPTILRRSARLGVRPVTLPTMRPPRWGSCRLRRISAMPNRPTATETKLNPASRSGTPKVNRAVLVNPSRPTVLSRMPSTIMARAFSVDPLARAIETTSPRTTTANSSAWPKFSAARASGIAATARTTVARVPATKEEMAGHGQGGAGPALPRHLVPVERGHRRGRLPRQVDEDRGRRPAVLRAVVDAGQHDDRGDRLVEGVGDGQQHGHRGGRPDPRQHPHGGAQGHADQAEEHVLPLQRRLEAEGEVAEEIHGSAPQPLADERDPLL